MPATRRRQDHAHAHRAHGHRARGSGQLLTTAGEDPERLRGEGSESGSGGGNGYHDPAKASGYVAGGGAVPRRWVMPIAVVSMSSAAWISATGPWWLIRRRAASVSRTAGS